MTRSGSAQDDVRELLMPKDDVLVARISIFGRDLSDAASTELELELLGYCLDDETRFLTASSRSAVGVMRFTLRSRGRRERRTLLIDLRSRSIELFADRR